jgi:hypothetical protein
MRGMNSYKYVSILTFHAGELFPPCASTANEMFLLPVAEKSSHFIL